MFTIRRVERISVRTGRGANTAIDDICRLNGIGRRFFEECRKWHKSDGSRRGRMRRAGILNKRSSPGLRTLSLHFEGDAAGDEGSGRAIGIVGDVEQDRDAGDRAWKRC